MTLDPARLVQNTWGGVVVMLAAFALLFAALHRFDRRDSRGAEIRRKLLHTGSGLLTLSFPFLFAELWPVLLLTGLTSALMAAIRFLAPFKRYAGVVGGVGRTSLGEIYFPVAVAILFWLTADESPLLFVIPVLVLTLADATCALVGLRYGMSRYTGASKTLEGSVAFAIVAFYCIHVPLLLWTDEGRAESLLIAATLALLVMLLEGSAWRGLDNLFIPLGGYFLLRVYVTLDVMSLLARFAVAVLLVAVVLLSRRHTTLEDDSLVAGAFLAYVAWALMGWQWLVAPVAVFVGSAWMSPPTDENSRRIHDVPAVLSIWAAAVVWLGLARGAAEPPLLFPYTVVFAAHLAIFGTSRLASQFPERSIRAALSQAAVRSWAIVLVPFLILDGAARRTIVLAAFALIAIAAAAALFVTTQRTIRDTPLTGRRWAIQAGCAAVASLAAWLFDKAVEAAGIAG